MAQPLDQGLGQPLFSRPCLPCMELNIFNALLITYVWFSFILDHQQVAGKIISLSS